MRFPAYILGAWLFLAVGGCAVLSPGPAANRPDGEGFAGVGELIVRISLSTEVNSAGDLFATHRIERAWVEIRYLGLDSAGRAVFLRRDHDVLAAGSPAVAAAGAQSAPAAAQAGVAEDPASGDSGPDTHKIHLDLRLARQLRIQGKVIEVVEANATGVVFRLY